MELKIIPVVQVIIAALLMVTLATLIPELHYLWFISKTVSILLVILAAIIGILAIYCFKKAQTTVNPIHPEKASSIVRSGIYHYSRNPMYLAMLLVVLAIAVYLQNIASFIIIPLFIGYITRYQIIPEERMLIKIFGDNFREYCKMVRRWL